MLVTLVDVNGGGCPVHTDIPQGSWLGCPRVFGRIAPPSVRSCHPLTVICKAWAWVPNWIIQRASWGIFLKCSSFVSVCRTVRDWGLPTARSQPCGESGLGQWCWHKGMFDYLVLTSLNPVSSLPWLMRQYTRLVFLKLVWLGILSSATSGSWSCLLPSLSKPHSPYL